MTRAEFFKDVLPKGSRVAELGVFLGTFSDVILELNKPQQLYLVDPFDSFDFTCRTLDDKNSITIKNFQHMYGWLEEKYQWWDQVELVRDLSTNFLDSMPENSLDCVYIDTIHTYEQCKNEIEKSLRVVNGWIGGHDYQMDGVRRAVDEFRSASTQIIITDENLSSFFMRI